MQTLRVRLENCYGIRSPQTELDFSHKHAAIIYAPNGMMKTSLARTFKDHSQGNDSKDLIYPDRDTTRHISDQDNNPLPSERVFVIEPYDFSYESSRVSTLLANSSLKEEYDKILADIEKKRAILLARLKKISGLRSGIEDIISLTLTRRADNLMRALDRIKNEVYNDPEDTALSNVKYNTLFGQKIQEFLQDEEIRTVLSEYTETYDTLLSQSRFFRKGIFNHYQATEIAKQLKNHGFFKAEHKIYLNSKEGDTKVGSEAELVALINEELEGILSNENLKASFDKIDNKLTTKELRDFREFLLNNQTLIPRLRDPEVLKEDLLKSYLMASREEFKDLMDLYDTGKDRIDQITKEASDQATRWQEVINIFNRRFSVPFKVGIENKEDVILKRVTPNIGFTFEDEASVPRAVKRKDLLDVLSSGESRALYLLNIIFEVEGRIADGMPTVFVMDDIADSFDYKNKYAIVEYLADILAEGDFRQIILTHNYDFYRTVWRRLDLGGANYHVSRSPEGIALRKETMYRDPFQKWKGRQGEDGNQNAQAVVAMVPFVRNLAEYCGYEDEYEKLTSIVHVKVGQPEMTVGELLEIYKKILNGQEFSVADEEESSAKELVLRVGEECAAQKEAALDLEKKVVLSICIRLLAEQIMIEKIDDEEWLTRITKNQTAALTKKFKETFAVNADMGKLVELMDRVGLMTPENIHLNSFMYEPILDMSSEHLRTLYEDIKEACNLVRLERE